MCAWAKRGTARRGMLIGATGVMRTNKECDLKQSTTNIPVQFKQLLPILALALPSLKVATQWECFKSQCDARMVLGRLRHSNQHILHCSNNTVTWLGILLIWWHALYHRSHSVVERGAIWTTRRYVYFICDNMRTRRFMSNVNESLQVLGRKRIRLFSFI